MTFKINHVTQSLIKFHKAFRFHLKKHIGVYIIILNSLNVLLKIQRFKPVCCSKHFLHFFKCKLCHFNNNRQFKNKLIEFLYRLMNLILHNKMSPFSGTVKTLKNGHHLQGWRDNYSKDLNCYHWSCGSKKEIKRRLCIVITISDTADSLIETYN